MAIPRIVCNTRGPSAVDLMTMIEDSLAPYPTGPLNDAEQSRLVADIDAALPRVHRYAPATPLLRVPSLDSMIGGQVLLKAECAQATGSFKIRGALNVMTHSPRGVWIVSSRFPPGIMVSASPMPLAAWG